MIIDQELKSYLKDYYSNDNKESYYFFLKEVDAYIKKVLFRKIANKELLEDTSQEIMLGIHKSIDTYDQTKSILPWINSIIFHKTIDFYRKQSKFSKVDHIDNFEIEGSEILLEDKVALKEILSELSNEVFGSAYLQQKLMGQSIEDISKDLGMTKSNTKVIFHRLTKKLKGKFNE